MPVMTRLAQPAAVLRVVGIQAQRHQVTTLGRPVVSHRRTTPPAQHTDRMPSQHQLTKPTMPSARIRVALGSALLLGLCPTPSTPRLTRRHRLGTPGARRPRPTHHTLPPATQTAQRRAQSPRSRRVNRADFPSLRRTEIGSRSDLPLPRRLCGLHSAQPRQVRDGWLAVTVQILSPTPETANARADRHPGACGHAKYGSSVTDVPAAIKRTAGRVSRAPAPRRRAGGPGGRRRAWRRALGWPTVAVSRP